MIPFQSVNSYNFLDKSVGLTTLVDRRGNLGIDNNSRTVETRLPLYVPGLEGLEIPRNTRGHVLKVIDDKTALVRWEVKLKCLICYFLVIFYT